MDLLKKQISRIFLHIINTIQKSFLGDDPASIILRNFLLRLLGAKIGKNVKILGGCDILGGNVTFCDGVCINRNCYLDLAGPIYFGENVGVGHGTTFITAKHEMGPEHNRAGHIVKGLITGGFIKIEKGAWIGANVTILSEVTVGEGAVVVTASMANKDVEPNTMVFGVPARKIKSL